jgi:hypothetical protein
LAILVREYNQEASSAPITVVGNACELPYAPVLASSRLDLVKILKLDSRLHVTESASGVLVREKGDTSEAACVLDTSGRGAR